MNCAQADLLLYYYYFEMTSLYAIISILFMNISRVYMREGEGR